MEVTRWEKNPYRLSSPPLFPLTDNSEIEKAINFHRSIPGYTPTPLLSLPSLARSLGLKEILVKDESSRFGLNSFKGLGVSYAVANALANGCRTYSEITEKIKTLPTQTFATATDGNHGRGLAWSAQQFGQKAVVYLPKGSSLYRLNKIRELGAKAEITDVNYDETVRFVSKLAKENGWILVQDTAWEGYEKLPELIMQGYLTMLAESITQWKTMGQQEPTHVILQAGVGTFGASMAAGLQQLLKKSFKLIVVEPTRADCFFQSGKPGDGKPKNTSGDLSTIMAGLSCGVPNPIAWTILKNMTDLFVTCPDNVAARGMRILGNPLGEDPRIISGESGAIPLGLLYEICKNTQLKPLKESFELDESSRVFFLSTEGDTDPQNYREVCWNGKYPN